MDAAAPALTTEDLARALYEACPTVKPTWEQLGEVTKGVWRDEAVRRHGVAAAPPGAAAGLAERSAPDAVSGAACCAAADGPGTQGSLF